MKSFYTMMHARSKKHKKSGIHCCPKTVLPSNLAVLWITHALYNWRRRDCVWLSLLPNDNANEIFFLHKLEEVRSVDRFLSGPLAGRRLGLWTKRFVPPALNTRHNCPHDEQMNRSLLIPRSSQSERRCGYRPVKSSVRIIIELQG